MEIKIDLKDSLKYFPNELSYGKQAGLKSYDYSLLLLLAWTAEFPQKG